MTEVVHSSGKVITHEIEYFLRASIGTLAGTLTVNHGVSSTRTVAIQCLIGRSPDKYFVYQGSLKLEDLYDGMKEAFDAAGELYKQDHMSLYQSKLSQAQYDDLLQWADLRKDAWEKWRGKIPCLPQPPHIEPNGFIIYKPVLPILPIWRWAYQRYGMLPALFTGSLCMIPLFVLTLIGLALHRDVVVEIIHLLAFFSTALYCGCLLDVRRGIHYIKIESHNVSEEHRALWKRMFDEDASLGRPSTVKQALQELKLGKPRKHFADCESGQQFLVLPVIGLTAKVPYHIFEWFMFANIFRGTILSLAYLYTGDHVWFCLTGGVSILQASMQANVTSIFVAQAKAYRVHWFRRMPNFYYEEELENWRLDLR